MSEPSMEKPTTEIVPLVKWQPVMLVINRRLECRCGALAVFVSGHQPERTAFSPYNLLEDVDCWCQVCFVHAQQEDIAPNDQGSADGESETR